MANTEDFGPGIAEFPEEEWLLHSFTVWPEDQLNENGERFSFNGPNGRYISLRADVEHKRRQVSIQLWNEMEEKDGWGPNESLEVHHRYQGGDWKRLTTGEICSLAEEYKPLTYWWKNA